MINAAETIAPRRRNAINAAETIPPYADKPSAAAVQLIAGESVSDSYIVHSAMTNAGKQASIYMAQKWGKPYVIKLYHSGWHPSEQMRTYLSNVRHPNIAHLVDSGDYHGSYYEIYEYYAGGTLEETGALPSQHIETVIVPSINNGLHELHRNGIVHCDIKPSNLFYSRDKDSVIIGDCGISEFANANGKLIDSLRGTPEYAPRVRSLLWSAAMSPAYDYGSFGLVLCRLILGRSLFAGMSVEEISRAWENGIELPSQINGRLLTLVKGLINEDENERWGYLEVKRWCEGEFQRAVRRGLYTDRREGEKKPLIYGRFQDRTVSVSTLPQLAAAIRKNWDQAKTVIRRRELVDFIGQFDRSKVEAVRTLARSRDLDAAVFKLLTMIEDEDSICFKGKTYPDVAAYVDALATGRDENAIQFLASGLLIHFLRARGQDPALTDRLEQLIKRTGWEDMGAIRTLCFAMQDRKSVMAFGREVRTLEELVRAMDGRPTREICELVEDESFVAWMNRLGYEKEMRTMKEIGG